MELTGCLFMLCGLVNLWNHLVCYGFDTLSFSIFFFKLNISYPATGCQKLIEVDDEKKLWVFVKHLTY